MQEEQSTPLTSFDAVEVTDAPVGNEAEIDAAVAKLAARPGGGLIVPPDTYTLVHRGLIVKSAGRIMFLRSSSFITTRS